jgi:hypothetical protein
MGDVLDQHILARLKERVAAFYHSNSNQHVNKMFIQLIQSVINGVFNQTYQTMTRGLVLALFGWINQWFYFHYKNVILYRPSLTDEEIDVTNTDWGKRQKMRDQEAVYNSFIANLWTLFLNILICGKVDFEINTKGVYFIDEMLSTFFPNHGAGENKMLGISLNHLDDVNLVNLFIIAQLKGIIFEPATNSSDSIDKTKMTNCKYNEALFFDGGFIVKHVLLLMVSGMESTSYRVQLMIYEQIRTILARLSLVTTTDCVTYPKNSDHPSKRPSRPNPATSAKYFWLKRLYLELLESDELIVRNPSKLFNLIYHYCSCKCAETNEGLEIKDGQCCSICHQMCQRWTSYSNEGELECSFYHVLGKGDNLPNILFISKERSLNSSLFPCKSTKIVI